ncbi:MAG: hypothetical protein KDA51_15390 [Planctomycetales bacterium]|nr:hypothetical protein [Planctomycetales bacterium]
MQWKKSELALFVSALATVTIVLSGCSNSDKSSGGASESPAVTDVDHSHGGWWCVEHGVPEGECALCDKSLAANFKEDGDWCEEHNRPESQCFLCSSARFEKFAARYEAKTGRQPPTPVDE